MKSFVENRNVKGSIEKRNVKDSVEPCGAALPLLMLPDLWPAAAAAAAAAGGEEGKNLDEMKIWMHAE